jgi:hypothetical protein
MMTATDENCFQQAQEQEGSAARKNNCDDQEKIMDLQEEYPEDEILIGPRTLTSNSTTSPCPCCNQMNHHGNNNSDRRQVVGELSAALCAPTTRSLLDDDDEDDDISQSIYGMDDDDDHMLPGLLSEDQPYKVQSVIARGWVHKKGTGNDWMRSRGWKPRWAKLVVSS